MTWLLTFFFGAEENESAHASLDEVFAAISEELAIPLKIEDTAARDAMFQHEHAINIEVILDQTKRRVPVSLSAAWEARRSQHARLALEADVRSRAAR